MLARDIMSRRVVTLRPDSTVQAAAGVLVAHGFTVAPVIDAGRRLVGIATEADLVRDRIRSEGRAGGPGPGTTVGDVMTGAPTAFRPDDDVADLVTLMLEAGFRSLPIVDDGVLVGIVSRRDVLRCVARGELTGQDVRERRAAMASHDRGEP